MKLLKNILFVTFITLLICAAMAFPVMWLWNWLIVDIFQLIKIDFWQALGLNILCGILFKSSSSDKD